MASERWGRLKKKTWVAAGTVFLGLGAVGLLVPVMPTVPFLLMSAGCYARGSARAYRRLMENPVFGAHLQSYSQGRGLARKAKVASIAMVAAGISFSILIAGTKPVLSLILAGVAAGVIIHILLLPTAEGP